MRRALLVALSPLLPALAAQAYPVGSRALTFANPTGRGTPSLTTTTWYPAQTSGTNVPLLPRPGGWPVAVFLHGFAALGSLYAPLGEHLAAAGYVAVFANTAQFSGPTLVLDGLALFPALANANAEVGGFLFGALDMTRVGLCGHSMGGGGTLDVLAQNPGYRAGVCLAPVTSANAGAVAVPVAVVHGAGDTIVPAAQGEANYRAATAVTGVRCFSLLDGSTTHTNVTGFLLISATDRAVFAHAANLVTGFFDRYLDDDATGLEDVLGPRARAQPRLVRIDVEVRGPELWMSGRPAPGQVVTSTLAAEPGAAALLAAAAPARLTTPFGDLLLDPASTVLVAVGTTGIDRLWLLTLAIPNDSGLLGVRLPFQALGTVAAGLRLSGSFTLEIQP
ncbi:MAG: hypothetical protein R3F56_08895 [Planctomycetota bacterium]